jgi:DNA-binding Lrp family transcriptional regulator|tara:strand:- start:65 stop:445 length:381 start_codon:yes stop_codon:yes gene_type:complete
VKERILAFCLKHWKEIGLVLLLLVVFGKSQYDMRNIIKAHETSEQSLRTQIETLRSLHSEELRIRDEAIERYQRDIEDLEERYKDRLDEIENLTEVEIDVIIKEFKEDKDLLAERFVETYGFKYVQ